MSSSYNASFQFGFKNYYENVKNLRRLYKDTNETIEAMIHSGDLNKEELSDFQSSALQKELKLLMGSTPWIVIDGQDGCSKLMFLTRLLQHQIIPVNDLNTSGFSESYACPWRALQIVYSSSPGFSFVKGCNLFSTNLHQEKDLRPLHSLSIRDFEIDNQSIDEDFHLKIGINHKILEDGLIIFITSSSYELCVAEKRKKCIHSVYSTCPILFYTLSKSIISKKEEDYLHSLKESHPEVPVLFTLVPNILQTSSDDLPEAEQQDILLKFGLVPTIDVELEHQSSSSAGESDDELLEKEDPKESVTSSMPEDIRCSLVERLGFFFGHDCSSHFNDNFSTKPEIFHEWLKDFRNFSTVVSFFQHVLNLHLVKTSTLLHKLHEQYMRLCIHYAFDMAREIQITPVRIGYVRQKESIFYQSLIEIALKKQDEISSVIMDSIKELEEDLFEKSSNFEFKDSELNKDQPSCDDVARCECEIREMVVASINKSIGIELMSYMDLMRDSFLGTLQRCLEGLQKDCEDSGENPKVVEALTQLMDAAYHIEVESSLSDSALSAFWKKVIQLVTAIPGRTQPTITAEWKRKIAEDLLKNLSDPKLAKSICAQFRDNLKSSHDSFTLNLRQLESCLYTRLERTEEQQLRIQKVNAPRLARLSLESVSLRDELLYGKPKLSKEVGRGQYGVVFSCRKWGKCGSCAVKSLVPLDDQQWGGLAMEFHYMRSIPIHKHVVSIRGSVIDHSYGQGDTPAVLLIMDRFARDLHTGLKVGLCWKDRMRISLDVIRGIRFLHSQGLVHRDIKLKNVLLDEENRAKLTDLGFSKPGAMMSGSIVGTPIHMAPEVFSGNYDNSVDTYAFGILFWYICSGTVKLPFVYEQCQSTEQLWCCVKRGQRPERLKLFSDDCWSLMQDCWIGEPSKRILLGEIEPRLMSLLKEAAQRG